MKNTKKLLTLFLALVMLASSLFLISSCGSKDDDDNEDEKENKVRYDLTDVNFSNITVEHFEYNYVIFDYDKNTYKLENKVKANGIVSKQTGSFTVGSNYRLEITNDDVSAMNYFLYEGETATLKDGTLHIEAYIPGYGNVSMTYKKSVGAPGGSTSQNNGSNTGTKYNLVSVNITGVTLDQFEYNYIRFDFTKGTYWLENKVKANGIVTKQTGTFTVDNDGRVTITNDQVPSVRYLLIDGETLYFDGDKFIVTAYVQGYGTLSMTYKK